METRPQKTSDFKISKSMDTFSLKPLLESEEEKNTILEINLGVDNSVFLKWT